MKIETVTSWLDRTLDVPSFSDVSNNGLQIANAGAVHKIAFGVDASARFFAAAAAEGADLAVCHHGISWGGGIQRVAGADYAAVAAALKHGIALYGVHLPLDANRKYGNNFTMARALGLAGLAPAFDYHGETIGCRGRLVRAEPLDAFLARVRRVVNPGAKFLFRGPDRAVRSVGVCSGGAAEMAAPAAALGCDVLLTGEGGLADYTVCENLGFPVVLAGHYRTEVWGVRALAAAAAKALHVPTVFINFNLQW